MTEGKFIIIRDAIIVALFLLAAMGILIGAYITDYIGIWVITGIGLMVAWFLYDGKLEG
jgi:hypothetical protein